MGAVMREAASHGTGLLWLGTHITNKRAQKAYKRAGFRQVGTRTYNVGGQELTTRYDPADRRRPMSSHSDQNLQDMADSAGDPVTQPAPSARVTVRARETAGATEPLEGTTVERQSPPLWAGGSPTASSSGASPLPTWWSPW